MPHEIRKRKWKWINWFFHVQMIRLCVSTVQIHYFIVSLYWQYSIDVSKHFALQLKRAHIWNVKFTLFLVVFGWIRMCAICCSNRFPANPIWNETERDRDISKLTAETMQLFGKHMLVEPTLEICACICENKCHQIYIIHICGALDLFDQWTIISSHAIFSCVFAK